jgi:hypothetical protein|tara:strand:+ start:299 stop:559 length:261 start_codon:yes stop_codon:yes gene_type:complete
MKTLTYNPDTQEWIESDDGKDPEVPSNDWYLKVLRNKRNQLLAETDFYALSDVTMSDEMKTYRQALRDLPANTSDPSNPTYPTKPS